MTLRAAQTKSPGEPGLFCCDGLLRPFLPVEPVVHFFRRLVLGVAVALLQPALKLVLPAVDDIEIVIGQLAPLLLDLALDLLPVSFDAVPVHCVSPVEINRATGEVAHRSSDVNWSRTLRAAVGNMIVSAHE